ncbi:MAG: A/G-specific adenine glycosylase [Planctomycetia bacterium]|nr:A/G-specific adenine glycosylase [Planctomycetia bacterium]
MLDARQNQRFRRALLAWFGRDARDLPWRKTRDPYHVWLSEIMLQQTQVATVVPYFTRFVAALPTIADLAAASEQTVLKLWEGLGYYRRARNLHRAARVIASEHEDRFPDDPEAVEKLPGIGRYTAGAILSIAFDQRRPILEANTRRLYARLLGYRGDVRSARAEKTLWQFAEQLVPRISPGRFNQALMELGATICRPRNPDCEACPVAAFCQAKSQGLQNRIPRRAAAKKIVRVREAAIVVVRGRRVLLQQRLPDERWAGLWDFPRFAAGASNGAETHGAADHRKLEWLLAESLGIKAAIVRPLARLRHGVTRFDITLDCYLARFHSRRSRRRPRRPLRWLRPAELDEYPLSSPARKLAGIVARLRRSLDGRAS